jgi:hypothetical protein
MKKKPLCHKPKRILRLPDLDHAKTAVLNTLGSPESQRSYRFAIDDFIAWYCSEPRLAFNKVVVLRYRLQLEARHLSASTIIVRLAAVRRLAYEAADSGLLMADSRNVLSVFGPQAAQTNYALASTILNLTPKRVSFWMSSREATGTAILMNLKPIYTVNAETGLFSVRTSRYRGYQHGDPRRARQVDLAVFDDQDHEFRFFVGSDPGKPITVTQPDINRILDTLRPVPASERPN